MEAPAAVVLPEHPRVLQVTRGGAGDGWCELQSALQRALFVAVDTEFTGWSDDVRLQSKNLEEKYAGLRDSVLSRALVEVGVSVFISTEDNSGNHLDYDEPESGPGAVRYSVRNFEFLLCCQSDFTISPSSGAFLSHYGFDFGKMFLEGIPYMPAFRSEEEKKKKEAKNGRKEKKAATSAAKVGTEPADGTSSSSNKNTLRRKAKRNKARLAAGVSPNWRPLPQGLLWRIGNLNVPLVVHNGLLDLLFLYSAFEGPLPPTLQGFISLLSELLPTIYDTKTIATSALGEKPSHLAYLFAKSSRRNVDMVTPHFISNLGRTVRCDDGLAAFSALRFSPPKEVGNVRDKKNLCRSFLARGYCPNFETCTRSHDVQMVLDFEQKERIANTRANGDASTSSHSKKRSWQHTPWKEKHSRKHKTTKMTSRGNETNENSEDTPAIAVATRTDHSAGFDAYCTGYIFATFQEAVGYEKISSLRNSLYISGRPYPLLLERSRFVEATNPTIPTYPSNGG